MKRIPLLIIVLFICFGPSICHAQKEVKRKPYQVWVKKTLTGEKQVGYLGALKESSIVLLDKEQHAPLEIPVDQIQNVSFGKKGRFGKGALIGAAVGFVFGAITFAGEEKCGIFNHLNNIFSPDPCEVPQVSSIEGGARLAFSGGLIGGLIGSIKRSYNISGNMDIYQKHKEKMKRFSY